MRPYHCWSQQDFSFLLTEAYACLLSCQQKLTETG